MVSSKMLTILVLALGLVVCTANVSEAVPIGTAFTYQGQLLDANSAADGLYDFQFKLYSASVGGIQQGSTIDVNELDVIDGYFTLELDFGGGIFAGDARWLEISVRLGELEDPNVYTVLTPRQELTSTPYAIYAQTAGGDNDWMVSGDNMYSIPTGKVGIGTTSPTYTFNVEREPPVNNINPVALFRTKGATDSSSSIRFQNTNNNHFNIGITRDDAFGIAYNRNISQNSDLLRITSTGNVGIGTVSPSSELHIAGTQPYLILETNTTFMSGISFRANGDRKWSIFTDTGGYSQNNLSFRDTAAGVTRLFIDPSGNVGIGTTNPDAELEVNGEIQISPDSESKLKVGRYSAAYPNAYIATENADQMRLQIGDSTKMTIDTSGNIGIGTTTPVDDLHVVGDARLADTGGTLGVRLRGDGQGNGGQISLYDADGTQTVKILGAMTSTTGGQIWLYKADGTASLGLNGDVSGNSRVITDELEIRGGSDLSEQFEIRGIEADVLPTPGMVVSIDPERTGDLMVSNTAYDRKVAGIISGAGGIKPGMLMGQKGSEADGANPVALTGRVYCRADASDGAIQPGDLLTTSNTPGHAMKVTDYTKAQGAILGKAMSSLEKGRGLVLVLVTLQ